MGSGEMTSPSGMFSTAWSCALAIGRSRVAMAKRATGLDKASGDASLLDVKEVDEASDPRRASEDRAGIARGKHLQALGCRGFGVSSVALTWGQIKGVCTALRPLPVRQLPAL